MPNQYKAGVVGLASTYDAGTLIAPHTHTAHQIAHAISGTMRVLVKNTMWFVPPGRAMWIPANTDHSIQCAGQVEMRTAYLSVAYPPAQVGVGVISVSHLMREILVRLAETNDCRNDIALVFADMLTHEIQQGALQPLFLPIPAEPRIAKLALQMQTEPTDQTSLKSWAKQLGFSERTLIRAIRAETGMTFRDLRRLTRIMVSLDKLSAGQSITETGFDVGFETPSAYIHAFRLVMGKTPRQFLLGK